MDNCWRENKNKYVLSYLSYLVQVNVFRHIYINFMLVGHTHNDVDQLFSVISKHFNDTDAMTIDDIHNVITDAMNGNNIRIEHIPIFPNYSGWVEKNKIINTPSGFNINYYIIGHSKIGAFYITKFSDDTAGIKFKKRMHNETWKSVEGVPYTLLKVNYMWTNDMDMVKFKDLKEEVKEFRKHLKAVSDRVQNERIMNILTKYIDDIENPVPITYVWDKSVFNNFINSNSVVQNSERYLTKC